jgi:mannose-1-phosphate guanylyltransferase
VDGLVGVVLAAGRGERLAPLTLLRPKPLCPVGNVPLIDLALERVAPAVEALAVNLHHGGPAIDAHLPADIHRSVEVERALGTAGALGHLRSWIGGRDVMVVNSDTWCPGSLAGFVEGWDRERIRLLLAGSDDLTPSSRLAAALMPWSAVQPLQAEPSGLYEVSWRAAQADGRVEGARHDGPFVDCGTPAQYLAANLWDSNGESVVEEGAEVEGSIEGCVIWSEAIVRAGESLSHCIRTKGRSTVLVR